MRQREGQATPVVVLLNDGDVHIQENGNLGKSGIGKVAFSKWQSFTLRVTGNTLSLDLDGRTVVTGTVKAQEAGEMALRSLESARVLLKDLWIRER